MARRTVSWIIGGGIAALALVLVLTAVPLKSEPVESQAIDVHASSSIPSAPACATMRLTGELESRQTVPLVDVWGLARVSTTIVSPVVYVGGDAPCPENTDVGDSMVIVFTPGCDNVAIVDSEETLDEVLSETHPRCGGAGMAIPGLAGDEGYDATTSYHSDQRYSLADSGVVAADSWCLDTEFWVGYSEGSGTDSVPADVVDGDLCVDLS